MSKQIEIFYIESNHDFLSRFYLKNVSNLVISTRVSSNRDFRRDNSILRTVYNHESHHTIKSINETH